MLRLAFIVSISLLSGVLRLNGSAPDPLLLGKYPSSLHNYKDYLEFYNPGEMEIWFGDDGRFNSDTLLLRIVTEGAESVLNELYYYAVDLVLPMPQAEKNKELDKIRLYARQYRNDDLDWLADCLEMYVFFKDYPGHNRLDDLEHMAERSRGTPVRYALIRWELLRIAVADHFFSAAFRMAAELEKMAETDIPFKNGIYYSIGELHYMFRDYEKAIPLFEKSLSDTIQYFFQRYDFQARNTLGLYYRTQNEPDRSDGYFLSMLSSPAIVKYRPMYDAMAYANLGRNHKLRGDYMQALRLLRHSLPTAEAQGDYPFAAGVTADMGDCYLALGRPDKVKHMIDSTVMYMGMEDSFYSRSAAMRLYPLMSKYYSVTGNNTLSAAYLDSTIVAHKRNEDRFNAFIAMRVEQELHDAEHAAARAQIRARNKQLIFAGILLLTVSFGAAILAWLYKRKRDAYRELVHKGQQWAGVPGSSDNKVDFSGSVKEEQEMNPLPARSETADNSIMKEIERLMKDEKLYIDPELSLSSLSGMIGTDRRIVSGIINRCAGKNFNTYVNEYRIKEAIHLMSDPKNRHLSIDGISQDSGFNDRRNFYRIFKQYTGLTPAAFRDNI